MQGFKNWLILDEGVAGYLLSTIGGGISVLSEGRKNPERLRQKSAEKEQEPSLFDISKYQGAPPKIIRPKRYQPQGFCTLTPLSGYERHTTMIRKYAFSNPENFAQVLMFSPLSANVPFVKHWDNFQVLMLILKHYFPRTVERNHLEKVLDGFSDKYHAMGHSIANFGKGSIGKFDTIATIWNNRERMFQELPRMAEQGQIGQMIEKLSAIPGVQPIKAGFMIQMLFGKAGCIDTHNIDIYTKAFPELAGRFDMKKWSTTRKGGIADYMSALEELEKRGIGTKQLWDVWVEFMENFWKMTSETGEGPYADMGAALDPSEDVYKALRGLKIPKERVGQKGKSGFAMVPVASGKGGMGASATHLQADPEEMMRQFHKMYQQGQRGTEPSSAIPFRAIEKPGGIRISADPASGLATKPSLLHYFGKALDPRTGQVDPDIIRREIERRLKHGGPKATKARAKAAQRTFF